MPIVDRWSASKPPGAWLFDAPGGGPPRESLWKRSVGWRAAVTAIDVPSLRVHDLRQRRRHFGWELALTRRWFSGCWGYCNDDGPVRPPDTCQLVEGRPARWGHSGASGPSENGIRTHSGPGPDTKSLNSWAFWVVEPPIGIEPMTYALREARLPAPSARPALMHRLGRSGCPECPESTGIRSTTRSTAVAGWRSR